MLPAFHGGALMSRGEIAKGEDCASARHWRTSNAVATLRRFRVRRGQRFPHGAFSDCRGTMRQSKASSGRRLKFPFGLLAGTGPPRATA